MKKLFEVCDKYTADSPKMDSLVRCMNGETTIEETRGWVETVEISFITLPILIETNINTRIRKISANIPSRSHIVTDAILDLMEGLTEANEDLTIVENFGTCSFASFISLKNRNHIDTFKILAGCVDFFITPYMIESHTIQELFDYAYKITKMSYNHCDESLLCEKMFPDNKIDMNHDYYSDLLEHLPESPPLSPSLLQDEGIDDGSDTEIEDF